MDAPLYENLPGFVTSIRAVEVPKIPQQKLQFPDGANMTIAAGATLCKAQDYPPTPRCADMLSLLGSS